MLDHLLESQKTIFAPISKALALADKLNSEDEDWEYVVITNPLGLDNAIIEVYDKGDPVRLGLL